MKQITMLDGATQYRQLRDELLEAIDELLASGRWIGGAAITGLEEEIAQRCGCSAGIGVASGTDALLLTLKALGVGPGVDVVVPSFTFFATAGAVVNAGGRPLFADIEPDSFNLDPDSFTRVMSRATRVVIPVDLFGRCADHESIAQIAEERGVVVLEDAAQAIGASRQGYPAGSFGRAAAFSFYPTKNLGACGDAGMVTTNDPELAARVRCLAAHGMEGGYRHKFVGTNSRLDALQAAILRVKLGRLDQWQGARRRNALYYTERFTNHPALLPPQEPTSGRERRVYHQYVVRILRGSRDRLMEALASAGIDSAVYYPLPLHLQECFRDLGGRVGDCPVAEEASRSCLALPIHPDLDPAALERVAEKVLAWADRQI